MRLFHLADLHLGKCIHGYSMVEMGDQPFWVEELLKKAEEIRPDAVLISGDVYDRAVPSKEAVTLLDDLLTGLSVLKIPVLMIAGNHDSGARLSFGGRLLTENGIYIAGELQREAMCVTLQDEHGSMHFWLIPYLFPAAVSQLLQRDDLKDYDSAMREYLKLQDISWEDRNVVLSHQFVTAGDHKPEMGGSETTVGGIGQIDSSVYDGFDYVALGHIHNAQQMGKTNIRYAGSPLWYHFGEANQKKGLTIVSIEEKGNVEVRVEEMPCLHKMAELSGTMEELLKSEPEENSYLRVVIRQEILPPQAVETLRDYFESKHCILMGVTRDFSYRKKGTVNDPVDVRGRSLEELFTEFYQYQHDGELPGQALEALISYTAEQTRNSSWEESEKEKIQSTRQLINYAVKCGKEGHS